MAHLRGMASGHRPDRAVEDARRAWQESMERRLDSLRGALQKESVADVAFRSGAQLSAGQLRLRYWDREVLIDWPSLQAEYQDDGPCSTFDTAMLLYFIITADGSPAAGRWISFRELPDGGFYHQAFQGYSGNRIATAFGGDPAAFTRACEALDGEPIADLSPHAFAFHPFERLALAAALWPGDEELPGTATVLFDASASRYLPTDGLALLGSGLAGRLVKYAHSE